MRIADLYIRVSTDEQADVGYSQRYQEEVLRKYCDKENIRIRHVIYEDHSAKSFHRPEWMKLLIILKKQKRQSDLVLFTKWDRFSRNAGDAYQMINVLRKAGVEPQAIEQPLDTSIPENKMMLAFYLAAPEVENDRRALNVFYGMRRAKKEGRYMGIAPIGYINKVREDGKKYIALKQPEAGIIKRAFEQVASGPFNVNQLYLDATAQGLKLARSAFHLLLRNPVYCGRIAIRQHKDEPATHVRGQHEPLVSEDLWFRVQDILSSRQKVYSLKLKDSEPMLLRGVILCPKCGKNLSGNSARGRAGRLYYYYQCLGKCALTFKTDVAHKAFLDFLKKFVPKPGRLEVYSQILNEAYRTNYKPHGNEISKTREEILNVQSRLSKARELLLNGDIDANDFKAIKTGCEKNIVMLEARMANLSVSVTSIKRELEKAVTNLSCLDKIYQNASVRRKRELIGLIFPEKLSFDGFHFQTTRVNEVASLIYRLGAGFSGQKKQDKGKKSALSCEVTLSGFKPETF